MKRFLAIFIFILGLVGCANEDQQSETPLTTTPEVVEQNQTNDSGEEIKLTPQFDPISLIC